MRPPSILRQARALVALVLLLALAVPWACLPRGVPARRRLAVLGWALVLRGFGIGVRVSGARATGAALFVANHVSWTDIAVLGHLLDAGFVAKAEVARWPLLGALARRYGCLFVDRTARAQAGRQALAIERQLSAERSVILFPEGTTGEGDTVLPFRSSLFAGHGGRAQPVTIRYLRRDGSPLVKAERRAVAWLADDALLPHALALAASGGLLAEVTFEQPVSAECRKDMAQRCRDAIAARLGDGQAATLNRAA